MADKSGEACSTEIAWFRTRLPFSLLRSAVACIRSVRHMYKESFDTEDLQSGLAIGLADTDNH